MEDNYGKFEHDLCFEKVSFCHLREGYSGAKGKNQREKSFRTLGSKDSHQEGYDSASSLGSYLCNRGRCGLSGSIRYSV